MAKEKRASWWKMFRHQRQTVEAVSDADAGAAIKAAFRYFDGETVDQSELSPVAWIVFITMRGYIDESVRDFQETSEKNRRKVMKRWNPVPDDTAVYSGIPENTAVCDSIPPYTNHTEAEAEAEADANIEERSAANIIINNKAAAEFSEIPDEDLTDEQVMEKYADVPYDQKPLSWYNARKRICFNQMEQIK